MEKMMKDSKYVVIELADYIEKNKRFGDNVRFVLFLDKINLLLRCGKIAAIGLEQDDINNKKSQILELEKNQLEHPGVDKSKEINQLKESVDKNKKDFDTFLKAFDIVSKEFEQLIDYVHDPATATATATSNHSHGKENKQDKDNYNKTLKNKYKKNKLYKKKNKFGNYADNNGGEFDGNDLCIDI